MHVLDEIGLECAKAGVERSVRGTGPCRRLKAIGEAMQLSHRAPGFIVIAEHDGDGLAHGVEAIVHGGDHRVLIHLRNKGKQDLFLTVNVGEQAGAQIVEQGGNGMEFGSAVAALFSDFVRHFGKARQVLAHALVMGADDVLNEAGGGECGWVSRWSAMLAGVGVGKLLEHLIDGELEVGAGLIERGVGLCAEVNVETLEDTGG
jgi:hypothetical protein